VKGEMLTHFGRSKSGQGRMAQNARRGIFLSSSCHEKGFRFYPITQRYLKLDN